MVANPLNSAYCVGAGLNVDTLGRPVWKRELAGIWTSPPVQINNLSGSGNVVLSNLVARIQNTTAGPRELMVRAQAFTSTLVDWNNTNPIMEFTYAIGPTVTEGVTSIGVARMDMYVGHGILMQWPGVTAGPTFVTVAAGGAMNVAITALTRAVFTGLFNSGHSGTMIEAHWLGA